MSAPDTRPSPENCPEPFWHNTHRYCPVCTWTEPLPPKRCDIRGCEGVATSKWWAGDHSFYIELCDKHSAVKAEGVEDRDDWHEGPTYTA